MQIIFGAILGALLCVAGYKLMSLIVKIGSKQQIRFIDWMTERDPITLQDYDERN